LGATDAILVLGSLLQDAEVVVDPVTLIVGALAAGALKGAGESATTAVKDTYQALKTAVASRFTERQVSITVLAEHEEDPDTYEKPLAKQIQGTGASDDPRIVELAQALMRLMDQEDGALSGKYTVDIRGAKGVQIGDHSTQHNTFT
jgi:hypothetical protein